MHCERVAILITLIVGLIGIQVGTSVCVYSEPFVDLFTVSVCMRPVNQCVGWNLWCRLLHPKWLVVFAAVLAT